ncbi:MAG TPA: nuclear transport factor 2 family protein [Rhizobiaceae bacterium]|nr:nuclear transport factor 2 family protein [Rhizobiaceae bacterium]
MKTGMVFFALACLLAVPAHAQELPQIVSRWYDGLRTGDAATFGELIAEGASIELKASGIVQTRDEFIASLDDWAQLATQGQILVRPVSATPDEAVAEVCYRFPGAERMNRETFSLAGGKVTRLVQEEAGAGCPGF